MSVCNVENRQPVVLIAIPKTDARHRREQRSPTLKMTEMKMTCELEIFGIRVVGERIWCLLM